MPSEAKERLFWGLLTNAPSLQATTIIQHYKDRWQIEVFFRSLKQCLGLKQLPGYDHCIILVHIGTVLLAYICLAVLAYVELGKDEQLLITVST